MHYNNRVFNEGNHPFRTGKTGKGRIFIKNMKLQKKEI